MIERMKSLEDRVLDVLRRELGLEVDADTDVIDTGLLDSLSFVDLLVRLEDEFSIEIGVAELEVDDFRNARAIASYLGRRYELVDRSGEDAESTRSREHGDDEAHSEQAVPGHPHDRGGRRFPAHRL